MGDSWNKRQDEIEHRLYVERTPRWRRIVDSCVFWLFVASPIIVGVAGGLWQRFH